MVTIPTYITTIERKSFIHSQCKHILQNVENKKLKTDLECDFAHFMHILIFEQGHINPSRPDPGRVRGEIWILIGLVPLGGHLGAPQPMHQRAETYMLFVHCKKTISKTMKMAKNGWGGKG